MKHLFRFRAVDPQQQVMSGEREASDRQSLDQELALEGLTLISARRRYQPRRLHLTRSEQAQLCFHLGELLQAGIPLAEALDELVRFAESRPLRQMAERLGMAVSSGQPLSTAMRFQGGILDAGLLGIIQAGEQSGLLATQLLRLAKTLQQAEHHAAQTRRLLLQPLLSALVVGAATVFLMIHLVPQIRGFLLNSGQALPAHTWLLFSLADQLADHWPWLLGIPVASASLLLALYRLWPDGRRLLDRCHLLLPVSGRIERQLITARLCHLLATLYAAGIPIQQALVTLHGSCQNRHIAAALAGVCQAVEQGSSLASAFGERSEFPLRLVRMLRLGEATGALDRTLYDLASLCERDAELALGRLQAALAPGLTMLVGLLLGWVMLATLQPIYGLLGEIGR